MSVSYLIYTSMGTELLSKKELESIWQQAKHKNVSQDITGLLLYQEGIFMQVLEGKMDDILSLYETIENDPRHICEKQPIIGEEQKRYFPEWSMGFKELESNNSNLPSLKLFLGHMDSLFSEYDKEKVDEILNFIFSYSGWSKEN